VPLVAAFGLVLVVAGPGVAIAVAGDPGTAWPAAAVIVALAELAASLLGRRHQRSRANRGDL
jgi:membrane protein implicated in regulation of membrane protease activity